MPTNPFPMPGLTGSMNKNGLIVCRVPWWCETRDEALRVGDPVLMGVPLVDRSWHQLSEGEIGYQVDLRYEGQNDEHPGEDTYTWEPAFEENPIETHPFIRSITKAFEGEVKNGRVIFEPTLSGKVPTLRYQASGRGGMNISPSSVSAFRPTLGLAKAEKSTEEGDPNPAFGMTSYPTWSCVYTQHMVRKQIPGDLINAMAKIEKRVPGPMSAIDTDGRDWLRLPSVVQSRGNCFEIQVRRMLSPQGKQWPPFILEMLHTA